MDAISIEIGCHTWRLLHVRTSLRVIRQADIDGTYGERASAVAGYIAEKGLSSVKIGIVLPREISICKSLDLPAPGLEAIDGIVRFEIEKHLPFALTEAYYGFQVIGKNGNIYSVVAGAAAKRQVDELIEIFLSAGICVPFIYFWHEAILNSLVHFGEIGKKTKRVFVGIYGHEITLDAFHGFLPVYSKRVTSGDLLSAQLLQRELAIMAACLQSEQDEFLIILSADSAGSQLALQGGFQGKMSLLNLKGMVVQSSLVAFGGALARTGSGKYKINLLKGSGTDRGRYWVSSVFAAVALVLVCLVAVSYVAKEMITLNRFDSLISRYKALQDSSGAKASKLKATKARIAVLESVSGRQSTIALDLLMEITETIPDDSWLTSIEYKHGFVIMEGLSQDASSLLIKLETSKLLGDFEFVAPIVMVSKGKEKFRIKARVKSLMEGKT